MCQLLLDFLDRISAGSHSYALSNSYVFYLIFFFDCWFDKVTLNRVCVISDVCKHPPTCWRLWMLLAAPLLCCRTKCKTALEVTLTCILLYYCFVKKCFQALKSSHVVILSRFTSLQKQFYEIYSIN